MGVSDRLDEEFEAFARRELTWLSRYALMLSGDRELARDLVQEVMVKAHSRWDRVSAAEHPRLYVRTMLTHEFLSWRRRWAVRHIVLASDDALPVAPAEDHASAVVERDHAWALLAGLPRQQRAVLVLRYYEGLSDEEIAAALGCGAGTVRGYASRALGVLRRELNHEVPGRAGLDHGSTR
jgi:RNA polymerase sigma-70 factor (sigma-E family)